MGLIQQLTDASLPTVFRFADHTLEESSSSHVESVGLKQ